MLGESFQGQGKVREFYFDLREFEILKSCQGRLKQLTRVSITIALKVGRNIWSHCELNDFFLMRKESLLNTYQL